MKRNLYIFVGCMILIGIPNVFAQTPNAPYNPSNPLPDWVRRNAEKRDQMERTRRNSENDADRIVSNPRVGRDSARRREILEEEQKRIEAIVSPNPADTAKYRDFLQQSKTGLFRLIPNFGCDTTKIIYVEGDCLNYVPNGWIYSFRQKNYPFINFLSDIRLDKEYLISEGFHTQGILVELGTDNLENITSETDGMKFLSEYAPATQFQEAKDQYEKLKNGIENGNFKYSNAVKYKENITYALRSIAYKSENRMIKSDKRSDVTIAFRIIRKEENGGISILWKEISRQKAPRLKVPKNGELFDIK